MSDYDARFLKKLIGPANFNAWSKIPTGRQPSLRMVVRAVRMNIPFNINQRTGEMTFSDPNNNNPATSQPRPRGDGRRTWTARSSDDDQIRDEPDAPDSGVSSNFVPSSSGQTQKRGARKTWTRPSSDDQILDEPDLPEDAARYGSGSSVKVARKTWTRRLSDDRILDEPDTEDFDFASSSSKQIRKRALKDKTIARKTWVRHSDDQILDEPDLPEDAARYGSGSSVPVARKTWTRPSSDDQILDEPDHESFNFADFASSSSKQTRKRAFSKVGSLPSTAVTAKDPLAKDGITAPPAKPRGRRRKTAAKPVVEQPSVAAVRKSARVAQAKEVEKDEDTVEPTTDIPKYLLNEVDRKKYEATPDPDECLINPDQIPQLEPSKIKEFLLAASIKLGADEYACFLHLKDHAYDIRAALNAIDDPNSAARSSIVSESGPGYWSTEDLAVFVYECNNPRVRGRVKKLPKVLPAKSRANIVNAYHRLKCYLCPVPRDHYFCSTRIHGSKPTLGYDYVVSGECQNCNHELPNGLESGDVALCTACGLYLKLFGEMRQNADVTEEVFNFDPNTACPCSADEPPIPEAECFQLLRRVKGREVFFFSREDLKMVSDQMHQLQCSDTLKKILNSPNLNTEYTHIVIGWPGLLKLSSEFANYDVNKNAPNASQPEVVHKRILWDNLKLLYSNENPNIPAIVRTLHCLAKSADGTYSFEELKRTLAMFDHAIDDYDQESFQKVAEGSAEDLEEFLSPAKHSPDFFYFGRITKDDEFESVFDTSCYDYFNWLSVHDDLEAAPANFTPPQILDPAEDAILVENENIGIVAFTKTFFESKRSAAKTAEALEVSEAFVRTFAVKHRSAIQSIYNSATKLFRPPRNTRKTK